MLRLVCVVLCLGVALGLDRQLDSLWETYKLTHNKQYGHAKEEGLRRVIWERHVQLIEHHNLEADMGKHTYWLGMNEYGDLTDEEYTQYLTGYIMRNSTSTAPQFMAPSNTEVPDMVDWREKGYVTEIKNQGHCGSCWSFSATGSLEGQHFKKTGKLVSLSEQNLVDCSKKEGNHGCKGGLMDFAFTYIKRNDGLDTEQSYPYKAKDGMCHFRKPDVGATDTGYMDIKHGSEDDLMTAVATVGPISVAIDASKPTFRMYKRGVYVDHACSSRKLDHGVLAVGYGSESGQDYWIVKNSWGASWGNKGYIMMARNHNNMCGIATQASYPLV
jgi:cathepsin L